MRWISNSQLTESQLSYSYAWKSLLEYGIVVAGGSGEIIYYCPRIELYLFIYLFFRCTNRKPLTFCRNL
jgi:hypothetical protein